MRKCIITYSLIVFIVCFAFMALAQPDTINIYERSLYELSQISISSEKKTVQKLNHTSSTIRIITSEQIEKKGYFTLEDALAELPGFQFRDIQGLNTYSFLRGLPRQNNAIIVLIDGIQINELNSGGFYGGGQYNLANVERIEVLYGPASVIYGSNAISGVINIVTKTAKQKQFIKAQMALGSFNTYLTDMVYSHKGEKIATQISGMFKTSNKADLSNNNNDMLWDDKLEIFETDYAFDAKINYKDFTAGFNYQNRQSSTTSYNPSVNTEHMGFGTLWNLQFINAYVKHNKKLSDKASIQSVLYNRNATVLGNSVKEVTQSGQTAYYRPNNLTGIEEILVYKASSNFNLVSGFFGYYEKLAEGYSTSNSSEYFISPQKPDKPNFTNNLVGGSFLQIDYRFLRKLQLSPGLRYEYSTSYKQVLTPRVSLLYILNKFTSKLIYAQAYRAPKPWDYTDGIGNNHLIPETFNSYEFSNIWFITDNLKSELSIYQNTLTNGIVKYYEPNSTNYYWHNSDKTFTNGAEISTAYKKDNFELSSGYSYTESVNQKEIAIPEIAKHNAFLSFNYSFKNHLNIGLHSFYFGKRKNTKVIQATQNEYVNSAFVFNASVSVLNYKNTNVQLIVKNLTNTEYYHTSNITPDRIRQAQRSFLVKLGYKIGKI